MERFSLKSSESGGDGTCRGFWDLTPSTSIPQWEAMATTSAPKSPWWPNVAPPQDGPPPARMICPPSDRWWETNESALYTHKATAIHVSIISKVAAQFLLDSHHISLLRRKASTFVLMVLDWHVVYMNGLVMIMDFYSRDLFINIH